jgi:hypothetical protein
MTDISLNENSAIPSDETTHFGFKTIAKDEKVAKVAEVFHSVATKYDIMNDLMSGGVHRIWKRFTIDCSGARAGQKILDLAGGTGDLTAKFSRIVGENGNGKTTDTLTSDTDTTEEKPQSPDPTFNHANHYDPPDTPKKSPQKNSNPMLRLAIPRSAKGRKTSVTFKEEKAATAPAKYKTAESELDLSDDEAEQDEVLSLETFTQDLKPQNGAALALTEGNTSNNCTDIVPLFPTTTSKKSSMTDLVPIEKVESKSLTNFASAAMANKSSSIRLPLTGPGTVPGEAGGNYSFSCPRPPNTSVRPSGVQQVQQGHHQQTQGGQQGVLKLNVAIAGEFSMGNFSPAPGH